MDRTGRTSSIAPLKDVILAGGVGTGLAKHLLQVSEILPSLEPSGRGELEITDLKETSFEAGLRSAVEWYRTNGAWWEPLKERAGPAPETAWI